MRSNARAGKTAHGVIYDREIAAAFGIDVGRLYTVTFVVGAVLGALGGAVMAPNISVVPGIGVEVIVLAFAVVVIGGMGSIGGTFVGALLVGIARAAAVHLAAAGRAVRHLRRDVARPGAAAAGPVHPAQQRRI